MISDLNATSSVACVLKKVDVGTLVEAMMAGLHVVRAVEVMDISESIALSQNCLHSRQSGSTGSYSVATFSSPGFDAIIALSVLLVLSRTISSHPPILGRYRAQSQSCGNRNVTKD